MKPGAEKTSKGERRMGVATDGPKRVAECCEPLINYVLGVNRAGRRPPEEQPDLGTVVRELEELMRKAEQASAEDPVSAEAFATIRPALCYFTDSVLLTSKWKHASAWGPHALQGPVDDAPLGDTLFWDLFEEVVTASGPAAEQSIELLFILIGLGFTGSLTRKPQALREKAAAAWTRLRERARVGGAKICQEAYFADKTRYEPDTSKSIWISVLSAAGGGLALFLVLAFWKRQQEQGVKSIVERIASSGEAGTGSGLSSTLAVVGSSALITVAVIALSVGGYLLVRLLINRAKSKRFMSIFSGLLSAQGRDARTVDEALYQQMEQTFLEGVEQYRRSGKNVYEQPWFVLVGQSGSGKSEALRHSRVSMPRNMNKLYQGVGGTVNMDWWFTVNAIILDTAGRIFAQQVKSGQHDEWTQLLKLLRRFRPKDPVNGVILVVPASPPPPDERRPASALPKGLLYESEAEARASAELFQKRFKQLSETLGVRFPVWVVVTMCDRIIGFRQFFEDLRAIDEQHQIVGWSARSALDEAYQSESVDEAMRELSSSLKRYRLSLLRDPVHRTAAHLRRTDEVDELFAMPSVFEQIPGRLRRYLDVLFSPSPGYEPPMLRGVYFTSAMQKGLPLDDLLEKMTGVPARKRADQSVNKEKALFLKDLLEQKVFREDGLVSRAQLVDRARRTKQRTVLAVATLAGLAFVAGTGKAVLDFRAWTEKHVDSWNVVATNQRNGAHIVTTQSMLAGPEAAEGAGEAEVSSDQCSVWNKGLATALQRTAASWEQENSPVDGEKLKEAFRAGFTELAFAPLLELAREAIYEQVTDGNTNEMVPTLLDEQTWQALDFIDRAWGFRAVDGVEMSADDVITGLGYAANMIERRSKDGPCSAERAEAAARLREWLPAIKSRELRVKQEPDVEPGSNVRQTLERALGAHALAIAERAQRGAESAGALQAYSAKEAGLLEAIRRLGELGGSSSADAAQVEKAAQDVRLAAAALAEPGPAVIDSSITGNELSKVIEQGFAQSEAGQAQLKGALLDPEQAPEVPSLALEDALSQLRDAVAAPGDDAWAARAKLYQLAGAAVSAARERQQSSASGGTSALVAGEGKVADVVLVLSKVAAAATAELEAPAGGSLEQVLAELMKQRESSTSALTDAATGSVLQAAQRDEAQAALATIQRSAATRALLAALAGPGPEARLERATEVEKEIAALDSVLQNVKAGSLVLPSAAEPITALASTRRDALAAGVKGWAEGLQRQIKEFGSAELFDATAWAKNPATKPALADDVFTGEVNALRASVGLAQRVAALVGEQVELASVDASASADPDLLTRVRDRLGEVDGSLASAGAFLAEARGGWKGLLGGTAAATRSLEDVCALAIADRAAEAMRSALGQTSAELWASCKTSHLAKFPLDPNPAVAESVDAAALWRDWTAGGSSLRELKAVAQVAAGAGEAWASKEMLSGLERLERFIKMWFDPTTGQTIKVSVSLDKENGLSQNDFLFVGDGMKAETQVKRPSDGGENEGVNKMAANAAAVIRVESIRRMRLLSEAGSAALKRPWGLLRAMAGDATATVVARPIVPDVDGPRGRSTRWELVVPFTSEGGESRTARIALEFDRAVARPGGE